MNQRARIAMSEPEVAAFLRDARKLQLGTINPDGTPHMVTMFYALVDGRIVFWTYGKAQKTRNMERDPRVSCLIETGEDYSELRGVLVYGTARLIDAPEEVLEAGMAITGRMAGAEAAGELRDYVEITARKRVAYSVEATRVVSWDHRKMAAPASA
ncbi:pyridoxamine 5'-phosphate oxidase family protein [Sphaerisporangium sp. TRM90804]|uniref:pyridoxamine 5'-phosphate oxidase family protein n=1 Tax=Sphaerisporangium sp. TRM90804 TaxID=3031113 RepID=UPI00244AA5FC|nr:pyridoxamine 5'-phosphate oxidase family protein [Sphaerisporangium sp. TRM90804]MDH2427732.1 pyridoxamine 5'-phosphate oxidase family protein [Sphaerisporangium sp. TRM90804]